MPENENGRLNALEYVGIPDAPPTPPPAPPAPPAPPPVSTFAAPVFDAEAAARITADNARLAAAGLATGEEFYAPGTRLAEVGESNQRARRAEFAQRKTLEQINTHVQEIMRIEDRRNIAPVPIWSLYTTDRGGLVLHGLDGEIKRDTNGNPFGGVPTGTAWSLLGAKLNSGLSAYLPVTDANTRKTIIDRERGRISADDRKAWELWDRNGRQGREPKPTRISLGVRTRSDGLPEIFRIGGPSYRPINPDTILDQIVAAFAGRGDFRAEWTYTGEKWALDVTIRDQREIPGFVGETHEYALRFTSSDVLGASFRLSVIAVRLRCLNASEIVSEREFMRRRHVGEEATILGQVNTALAQIDGVISTHLDRWSEAQRETIMDSGDRSPEKVFGALIDANLIKVTGGRDAAVANLMRAYEQEPGYSRASIVNAITRAAQGGDWWNDCDTSQSLETAAGVLLFNRRLVPQIDAALALAA